MKKLVYLFVVLGLLISCKKETKEYITDGIVSIGKPIGKIGSGVIDIDGNKYRTVIIGNQEWMGENLKVTKYNDGTTIPNVKDNTLSVWKYDTVGAWSYYNNDSTLNTKYGKLYNWFTTNKIANGYKNICPVGWHIPTYSELTILTDNLGGEKVAGGKMKEVGTINWSSPNTDATNSSLFSAFPGGIGFNYLDIQKNNFEFKYINKVGYWVTNFNDSINAFYFLGNGFNHVGLQFGDDKSVIVSIRCLKN